MKWFAFATALGALLLVIGQVDSGPVQGRVRIGKAQRVNPGEEGIRLQPVRFRANERAAVIVEGDHDPVMKLGVYVYNERNELAAKAEGGDVLVASWVPLREGNYVVQVKILDAASVHNDVKIVLK